MRCFPRLLSSFLSLLLAGCAVGPDYEAPAVNPPARFVSHDVLSGLDEAGKPGDVFANWWEGFSDPVLNSLVEAALAGSERIAASAARLEQARARLALADTGDAPVLTAGIDGGLDREIELGTDEDETSRSIFGALALILPLDVFGRTRRDVEAAQAGVEAAEYDSRSIVLEVSAEVASEYLRLRGNQWRLELLEKSVALQEKTLSIVRARFEAGLSPELDVRRAEASVERLRAGLAPLKESLINGRNRLAAISGRYPGIYEDLLGGVEEIPVYSAPIPNPVPLEVLAARPDVRRAEAELKRTIALIGVAEAEYYPAFQIASRISIGASGVGGEPTMGLLIATLNALINHVVLDGGARDAGLSLAKARAEEALADYRQALLDAVQEVETTLTAIQSSRETQVSLVKAVKSSSRSFEQAETLYQQGLISFLDVVDAQRVLAGGEQELAEERTTYATRIANLFQVLGTEIDPLPNTRD